MFAALFCSRDRDLQASPRPLGAPVRVCNGFPGDPARALAAGAGGQAGLPRLRAPMWRWLEISMYARRQKACCQLPSSFTTDDQYHALQSICTSHVKRNLEVLQKYIFASHVKRNVEGFPRGFRSPRARVSAGFPGVSGGFRTNAHRPSPRGSMGKPQFGF